MTPYPNDTKESYIKRMKGNHLLLAQVHYKMRNAVSMWLQLFNYAMSEDIYGEHWDSLRSKL